MLKEVRIMKANAQFPEEQSDSGEFERQEDTFRTWVTARNWARV